MRCRGNVDIELTRIVKCVTNLVGILNHGKGITVAKNLAVKASYPQAPIIKIQNTGK